MQKLRPYVLPGLFLLHLITLCVILANASRENDTSADIVTIAFILFPPAIEQGNRTRQMSGIPRLTFGSTVARPCAAHRPSASELPKRCASMFHYQDTNPSPI